MSKRDAALMRKRDAALMSKRDAALMSCLDEQRCCLDEQKRCCLDEQKRCCLDELEACRRRRWLPRLTETLCGLKGPEVVAKLSSWSSAFAPPTLLPLLRSRARSPSLSLSRARSLFLYHLPPFPRLFLSCSRSRFHWISVTVSNRPQSRAAHALRRLQPTGARARCSCPSSLSFSASCRSLLALRCRSRYDMRANATGPRRLSRRARRELPPPHIRYTLFPGALHMHMLRQAPCLPVCFVAARHVRAGLQVRFLDPKVRFLDPTLARSGMLRVVDGHGRRIFYTRGRSRESQSRDRQPAVSTQQHRSRSRSLFPCRVNKTTSLHGAFC
jgi:hypothetical protein